MRSELFIILLFFYVASCDVTDGHIDLEARGKKKKIKYGLLIYFADLIVKKIFVLKLIYAFVLWCVIHKAGYFLHWFVSYLKEKKHEHHEHPHDQHHYGPYHHYEDYGPYNRKKYGY